MIVKVNENENRYGKYFLAFEAPAQKQTVKFNTKLLDIKPTNRRKLDFTANAVDPEDANILGQTPEEIEDEYNNTPADDTNLNGFKDSLEPYVDDPENQGNDSSDIDLSDTTDFTNTNMDGLDTSDIQLDDDEDFTAGIQDDIELLGDGSSSPKVNDNGIEVNTDDDQVGDPNDPSTPDLSDEDKDFTQDDPPPEDPMSDPNAGMDQNNPAQDPATPPADPNDPNAGQQGPGLEYDSTRKYILFLNFETLINTINNYIEKLENILGDDLNINRVIKSGCDKLREIKDLCEEYILMKFDSQSYFQSRLFYQNAFVMVQCTLNMLELIKKYRKLNEAKQEGKDKKSTRKKDDKSKNSKKSSTKEKK